MTSALHSQARASKLNGVLELRDVALFAVEAKVVGGVDPANLSFSLSLGEAVWTHAPDDTALVFLHLDVAIEHLEGMARTQLATISLAFRLTYVAREPLAPDAPISDYVALASWIQAWPYFRAEVQVLSSRLGYPALVLPVLLPGQTADVTVREQAPAKRRPKARPRATPKRAAR